MNTVGLAEFGICYSAIPRCANTSIKLSLFQLQTGNEFESYVGEGPLWPHSTSKLEIHRNDITQFTHLTENDLEQIETDYDFWFTIIDDPLRRLFSSYYMLILLEDPHLAAIGLKPSTFPTLEKIGYSSIASQFEEFIQSQYLEYLMQNDVHFMPQSKLLQNFVSSRKLRFYTLDEIERVEVEINRHLRKRKFTQRFQIPRSNTSLVSIHNLNISMQNRRKVEYLYMDDMEMLKTKTRMPVLDSRENNVLINEKLMSTGISEIRERNRRIAAIYSQYMKFVGN